LLVINTNDFEKPIWRIRLFNLGLATDTEMAPFRQKQEMRVI
jgi:hypothetical protein